MEETLGKRIAKNRKRLGLTQDQLAERLGVTAQAVSKWENDQSCPDISTLPRIAAIFGITTDELLGSRPAVETTVVSHEDDENRSDVEINLAHTGRKSGLGLGIWLLLAGAVSLYLNMVSRPIPVWTVIWTTGLLTYGLFGLFRRFSPFRLGCLLAGGYFLAGAILDLPGLSWPVVLIVLGVLLLVRAFQKQPERTVKIHQNHHVKGKNAFCNEEGECFESDLSFGERTDLVSLDRLSSGTADCCFGQLTVDLRGCAAIAPNAQVELSCSFGELILLVPSRYRVVSKMSTAFGNTEIQGHADGNADTFFTVTGSANFGQVSIRYL